VKSNCPRTGKSKLHHDEWKKIHTDKKWQVMTNKIIYNVQDAELQEKCWRYKSISASLDKTNNINWSDGMHLLKDVSQTGTTWSVVYLPNSNELYFSVYQSWDKIYHIQGF